MNTGEPRPICFLVVDDEGAILRGMERMLRRTFEALDIAIGEVILVEDGTDAMAVVADRGSEIDFILCDVSMNRMGGPEFLRESSGVIGRHGIPFLMQTGLHSTLVPAGVLFGSKPIARAVLVAMIVTMLVTRGKLPPFVLLTLAEWLPKQPSIQAPKS
ncbi:response regulator [Candidatus Uhrbacteria bacterium]|nr:response regulator [Candidatus Uhrbacteria bacterium]